MSVVAHPGLAGEAEYRSLKTLYQLLSTLSHASQLEDVHEAAITSLLDATAADRAAILLFDDDGVVRFKASRGLSPEYQAAVTGHSPWPEGTLNAQPLVVPGRPARRDPRALLASSWNGKTFAPLFSCRSL